MTWRSLASRKPGGVGPATSIARSIPHRFTWNIVRKYGLETGISAEVNGLCVHSAATNALSHEADIAKVQEWLGHANVSTTRLYERRKMRPEGQPDVSSEILKLTTIPSGEVSR